MQYRRCQCGSRERWDTGEAVHPCQGCAKCQTTFGTGPLDHKPLEPHQWIPRFNPATGEPDRPMCSLCYALDRDWERPA